MKKLAFWLLILLNVASIAEAKEIYDKNNGMIVRISEIELYPEYLEDYLTFAENIAKASVEKEEGVISIYPMMKIKNKNQIRILEIYQSKNAYEKHIASKHFQTYKQGTLHMVKSLELVDMFQISPSIFDEVFKKKQEK